MPNETIPQLAGVVPLVKTNTSEDYMMKETSRRGFDDARSS